LEIFRVLPRTPSQSTFSLRGLLFAASLPRMQSRVGSPYFEQTERIGKMLSSLADVAEKSGVPPVRAHHLRQLKASLRSPFLFVVAGEVNSGKSTFLNALFQEDFCDVAPTPTTERIYYFKHGKESREVRIDDSFVEVFRPAPFLRDFHIVDTPGTNSIAEGHQEITERFIPMADLVIFVFSVTNPWGATTWEFIEQIYSGWLKDVVFVIQQKDLRSKEEIDEILTHMKEVSNEKLGREFPTFAVSARDACDAFTRKDGEAAHEDSGFRALESHISSLVDGNSSVARKRNGVLRSVRAVIGEVERQFAHERQDLDRSGSVSRRIDAEIEMESKRSMEQLKEISGNVTGEFARARLRMASMLDKRLGFFDSFSDSKGVVTGLERELSEAVSQISRNTVAAEIRTIESGLPTLHDRLSEIVRAKFDLPAHRNPGAVWEAARFGLAEDFDERLQGVLVDSENLEKLETSLHARRKSVRTCALMFVLSALACVLGFLFSSPLPFLAAVVMGVIVAPVQYLLGVRHRELAKRFFDGRMDRAETALERKINGTHEEYLQRYMRRFSALFDPAREKFDNRRNYFEPLFAELKTLKSEFADLEAKAPTVKSPA
ncbi:MAG: dynamin family protein, partial [Verrucomicrobiota bacterium]